MCSFPQCYAKSLQSCPTLCDPRDGSTPGSPVPGILQARTLSGLHFLLQCMKEKRESEVAQSCPTLSDPMDYSLPGSSVHWIFQARVLEWGAIAFSNMCPKWNQIIPTQFLPASVREVWVLFLFLYSSQAWEAALPASCHPVGVLCNPIEHSGMQFPYKMLQVIKFIRMACHYFCIIIQLPELWKVINHYTGDKLRS